MSISRTIMVLSSILLSGFFLWGLPQSELKFTLSLEQEIPYKFHIQLNCMGIEREVLDFKMPAIAPGYYRILDFAANVENFNVQDGNGNSLPWEKIAKNTWRVGTDHVGSVRISYDVKSNPSSVATSFIDEKRAYISTPSVFIYPDGFINHPVNVTLILPPTFTQVSTGLEPVPEEENVFYARDFDILYDCPIYIGNQEVISFDVRGIPHYVALESPGNFKRKDFTAGLKKMIETATSIIGDIPYRHYTFIFMEEGKGGLEHQNSTAVFVDVSGDKNPWLEKRLMKFLTHEYFHLYNVKAIRPIALDPFSYDGENSSDLLWFSEGGTVYYEFLILNRAGFLSRKECLEEFGSIISSHENNPARLIQSAADASRKAWTLSFFGSDKEISYYEKGLILSLLLDLKIRSETKNKKSLDNVMNTFYYEFYQKKGRGFTDREFRQVCEDAAGLSLDELFSYIYSIAEIDYKKYLGYAGLILEKKRDNSKEDTFLIKVLPNLIPLQQEIFEDWLKK